MGKKVLLVLADGFEEIEALTPVDMLRRAQVDVVIAGLSGMEQTSARGVRVGCDALFSDVRSSAASFDALILPGGGKGADHLAASESVRAFLLEMHASGKLVAAICAAPAVVLARAGVLDGRTATCYPGMETGFGIKTTFSDQPVVVDGNIVTSRGAGTALAFSLTLVELLCGTVERDKIIKAIVA
jgi:4-methyl-5(b-hydroxyethyl)-thiazole monophosphate biosynthesis